MSPLSTMLLFWAGVSAASLAAAILVAAVEVCTTGDCLPQLFEVRWMRDRGASKQALASAPAAVDAGQGNSRRAF